MCLHRSRPFILGTLGRYFLMCCVVECMYVFAFSRFLVPSLLFISYNRLGLSLETLLHPVGDSWKKALMEEWVFISDEHTDEQAPVDEDGHNKTSHKGREGSKATPSCHSCHVVEGVRFP